MKLRIYLYNPLTRHRPCEQAKPLREHMKRLRVFSRALCASCESASRNSPAMRRRASALPAAHRFHSRESAMKYGIYFYNPITRHRPTKSLQSPRDRSLSSRTSLPSPRASDETRNLFLQSINVALLMRTSQTVARTHEAPACFFAGAFRVMRERVSKFTGNAAARERTSSRVPLPPPRVGDETPNLFLQFANAASPNENPPVTAQLPVFSRTPLLFLYVGDETPNLFLQFANAASPGERPPVTA